MAKKKTSKKGKGYYKIYAESAIQYKNKIAKLERHIRNYPGDKQAKEDLKRIKSGSVKDAYKRKKPLSRPWKSKPAQIFAQMEKRARGVLRALQYASGKGTEKKKSVSTIGDLVANM